MFVSTYCKSFAGLRLLARRRAWTPRRGVSTLANNQHIYVHDASGSARHKILSYLPTEPPVASLAIGTTTHIPPTPGSLHENPHFLQILHGVIRDHAFNDPDVQAQAAMYASQAGSALGSGGMFFPANHPSQQRQRRKTKTKEYGGGGGGDAGASAQGGMGGAGRGGYIHVSDQRYPPDFGRVAYPEDILGSLELDSHGNFVDGTGRYQAGNTYRVVTNEGILGLSAYLRARLIEKLRELDAQARQNA